MKKKQRNTFLGINFLLGVSTIFCLGSFYIVKIVKNNQNNEAHLENDKNLYSNADDKVLKSFTGTVLTANDVAALGWNIATTIGATDWVLQAPNVVEIATNAFLKQNKLEFMFIPKQIKKIGRYAFGNTPAMKTLLFHPHSELETIEAFCFGGSGLTSIELPSSLTKLGNNAFEYSSHLTSVTFGANSNILVIDAWAFLYTGISSIIIPDSVISIRNSAFEFTENLTTVTISKKSSLKYILDNAFKDSAIRSIFIPDSVVQINDANIFTNTPFLLGENVSIGNPWKKNSSKPLYGFTQVQWNNISWRVTPFIGTVLNVGDVINLAWNKKTTVTLEDWKNWAPNVEHIGGSAFAHTNLVLIEIPDNISVIHGSAFQTTRYLETVSITPNSKLKSLGNFAFNESAIKAINIPDSVITIGEYCFKRTFSLTNVTISPLSKLTTIGAWAFHESTLTSFNIPKLVTILSNGIFFDAKNLKTVTFGVGSNLASIENLVFGNCVSLISINIPDSVTLIGENTFQGTTSLLGKNISMSIMLEKSSATPLYGFTQRQWDSINWRRVPEELIQPFMEEILMQENVITLKWDNKISITLSDWGEWAPNVNEIYGAFENATTLTSIEIPAKVTMLNTSSFAATTPLKSITFEANSKLTTIGNTVFKDSGITSISIPESVTLIGENAFLNTESLTDIEMNIRFKENISSSNYGFTESQISKIKWIDPSNVLSQSGNVILLSVGLSMAAIIVIGFGLFITIKLIKRDES